MSSSPRRIVRLLAIAAVAVAIPVTASAASPPHAGQFCSPSKTPPKGFKCQKGKSGKYQLVKA